MCAAIVARKIREERDPLIVRNFECGCLGVILICLRFSLLCHANSLFQGFSRITQIITAEDPAHPRNKTLQVAYHAAPCSGTGVSCFTSINRWARQSFD